MKFRLFAILALLILPLPALAGPREDVVSGANRCASYGDDRQWLDCYYGAAQPMRGALGLPASSAAQVSLARAAQGAGGAHADVIAVAGRCSTFADNRQWLDCYYGAVQPVRARLGLAGASAAQISLASVARGAAAPMAAAQPRLLPRRKKSSGWFSGMFGEDEDEAVPASEFGIRGGTVEDNSAPVDQLVSRMTAYTFDRDHYFTVTLDNGQTWRQVSGDTTTANWTKKPGNYVVSISRGWFGSYDLRVQGAHGMYKVNRVVADNRRR